MKFIVLAILIISTPTLFAQTPPKKMEVKKGENIKVKNGKDNKTANNAKNGLTKDIHYRFHINKFNKLKTKKRRLWKKYITWWIDTFNKNCQSEMKLGKAINLKDDNKFTMWTEHDGKKKEIYHFASKKSTKPTNNALSFRWYKGLDSVADGIKTKLSPERQKPAMKKLDAEMTTFQIAVVDDLFARVGGENRRIPGLWKRDSNVLVFRKVAKYKSIWHEAGHLFGLIDDTGGIMDKIHPKPGENGRYGNEKKGGWKLKPVRNYRCATIKAHLGIH